MELFYILLECRLVYVCFDATKKDDLAEFYGWKLNATKYEGKWPIPGLLSYNGFEAVNYLMLISIIA